MFFGFAETDIVELRTMEVAQIVEVMYRIMLYIWSTADCYFFLILMVTVGTDQSSGGKCWIFIHVGVWIW